MAPTLEERYKLLKGWDGERRWYEDKECNFQGHDVNDVPNEEKTRIKIVGQWTFDIRYQDGPPKGQIRRMAEKAYEAKLKSSREDCRPQSELDRESPGRTFQRDLEPKKQKVQGVKTAEDAKVKAKTALEKGLAEEWPQLAKPSARSAESRSSLTHTYHVRAPLAMSSSSPPPPPEVPPASYASSSGRGPWPLSPRGSANADAASGPEAKRFRYGEPKRWGESRDNAVVTEDQDWLNPEVGVAAVDRSTDDVPMQSEPPRKFCTRCKQEGHCAGEGCHALAPDAIPVTPLRPKAAAERPEAGGSKPISRARWGTSAPRTEWPDKPDKTEAA
ncbi:MAG: hypothetical protein QF745_04960, partial [Planctomycetota bacterium]|nr:hypothetical protein [Planctomycetota bacterium]